MIRRTLVRLAALRQRRRLDAELEGEIAAHLELAERDARAAGLPPDEARREARRQFGGVNAIREAHRDSRSVRWIETTGKDVRHGLTLLRRHPSFAAIAVAMLALGIGANAAMFSLLDAVILKALPFPEPGRLVRLWETPDPTSRNGLTTLNALDWMRLSRSFEALSVQRPADMSLTGPATPVRVSGELVSADFFRVFGVEARHGRTFLASEDDPGAAPVAVLSHALWRTTFGSDLALIGREVRLDGIAHTIVGVLPPGPFDRTEARFWKPLIYTPEQMTRSNHWLGMVGRLRPGVSIERARAEMQALSTSLAPLQPEWKRDWRATVDPYAEDLLADDLRQALLVTGAAVAIVLLIACANLANLLLARSVHRRREITVRAAIGASRVRIVRQLLTEATVLCLCGGALGLLLAYAAVHLAMPYLPDGIPATAEIGVDLRVVAFTAAISCLVALVVATVPAWQMASRDLAGAMRDGARGSSKAGAWFRRGLVVAEVALSLVLLVAALALVDSLRRLQTIDTGVRVDDMLTMSIDLPLASYPTAERAVVAIDRMREAIEAVAGVQRVGIATGLPLLGVREGEGLTIPGLEGGLSVRFKRVDAGYFDAFGMPVLEGRGILDSDRAGRPPALVVNDALASRLATQMGLATPVGAFVELDLPGYEQAGERHAIEVVGIVRHELTQTPGAPVQDVVYVPLAQVPRRELKLAIRVDRDPAMIVPDVQAAVARLDRTLALGDVRTMQQVHASRLTAARQPTWVIGAFAVLAAALAALGLYGVLAHTVAQQRREYGVRLALGASPRRVVRSVVGTAFGMVGLGLAIGALVIVASGKVLAAVLYQTPAATPVTVGVAAGALAVTAWAAAWLPARRASRLNPADVLRADG